MTVMKSIFRTVMSSFRLCLQLALFLFTSGSVTAAIKLDFPVDAGFTGMNRLIISGNLTFDFTIDSEGAVIVDVTTTDTNQDAIDTVNNWDGPVGNVSEPSLYNTTFTFTASGNRQISFDGTDGGVLGLQGQSASLIDGATLATPFIEIMNWALTSGTAKIEINSVGFGNSVAGSDIQFGDRTPAKLFMILAVIPERSR